MKSYFFSHESDFFLCNLIKAPGVVSPPTQEPEPDDQGTEKTCTRHALGKAICAFMMIFGVDLLQAEVVQALKDLDGDNQRGVWPDRFDKTTFTFKDAKKKQEIEVTINVKSVSKDKLIKEMKSNKPVKHVLVKKLRPVTQPIHSPSHCVFIKNFIKDSSTFLLCINSDPDNAEIVEDIDRTGNSFYRLICDIK